MELDELKTQRGVLQASITRFNTFLSKLDEKNLSTTDHIEIEERIKSLRGVLNDYEILQSKIEIITKTTDDENRTKFEDKYYKTLTKARDLLLHAPTPTSINQKVISNEANTSHFQEKAKLPQVALPEYCGRYSEWLSFFNTFTALVDKNTNLSKTEKFFYLKGCLKDQAAQVIHSLQVSDENYDVAIQLLKGRFENKKLIVHTHVKSIFDLFPLKQESFNSLRKLLDNFNKNFRALESLGQPTAHWDTLLIHILVSKLDSASKREWEEVANKNENFPTLKDLTDFLAKRCNVLEAVETKNKFQKFSIQDKTVSHLSTQRITCAVCKGAHFNFQCDRLHKMTLIERQQEIDKRKLCSNCLRPGHFKKDCKSRGCKVCGLRHNTILHPAEVTNINNYSPFNQKQNRIQESTDSMNKQNRQDVDGTSFALTNAVNCFHSRNQILLATAKILIRDGYGNIIKCRALLDSGSQSNFITKNLANKLKLETDKINIPVAGINSSLTSISNKLETTIYSFDFKYGSNETFLIVPKITENMPLVSFDFKEIQIPSYIELADDEFHKSGPVDVLLGASIFFNILNSGQIKLGINNPVLQKTTLGWILSGPINRDNVKENRLTYCNLSVSNEDLHKQVEKFFEVESVEYEEVSNKTYLSEEERECENHFSENYKRDVNGRFEVKLPTRDNIINLGNSKDKALKRFHLLEKRFYRDPNFKQMYSNFMQEYERLGHMSRISPEEDSNDTIKYYLPHHGVYKECSSTTRLRVVYDASTITSSGISLNDVLKTGPSLQDNLFSIITRFRLHNFVITADIEKMYRQINVAKTDRDLQRILWRSDNTSDIQIYCLNTVTYGMCPSSFLAVRCLQQAAIDCQEQFPEASKTIIKDFYMDDLLTGSDTHENLIKLKTELEKILNSAGFPLRKFCSNIPSILNTNDGNPNAINQDNYIISDNKNIKTLGLTWNPNNDTFIYTINIDNNLASTKRNILSSISKIFDPLGILAPIMINAKLILQNIWQLHLDWDELLPPDINKTWRNFCANLARIKNFHIPRQVTIQHHSEIHLHGFADSSMSAYGACVYVVSVDSEGNRESKLLCAKSRVAPRKTISLPRLELNGAVLLAKLMKAAELSLNAKFRNKFYWCDSTIVLCWIKREPSHWKTYVANRVSLIQNLTDVKQWFHVRSELNPADVLSRGTTPRDLTENKLWWFGPPFIMNFEPEQLETESCEINYQEIPEQRQSKSFALLTQVDQSIFEKFSSFIKLQRVLAFVLRFIHNSRLKQGKLSGNLNTCELQTSLKSLIRLAQTTDFNEEIKVLRLGKSLPKRSKILSLHPFLDSDNLLRVGGRLRHANISFDKKHPYLLSAKHPLTKLLIDYEHKRLLHAGALGVLYSLRNKFWIIDGKNAVKGVLRKCITCFKHKPEHISTLMGDIPKPRVDPVRPFLNSGVDIAGPILIRDSTFRNRRLIKSYVCLFVCFSTKAVHLELISDMTTETFLNALKRFISRRGICKNLYSDNGTNFVGANHELGKIMQTLLEAAQNGDIHNYLLNNQIQWHFNPPRSPHYGGLWERAIRSFKHHFARIVGNAHLSFEHLYTVLCQIECILNSRPLTPLSSDPSDLTALTPSHFLIGECLTVLPERNYDNIPVNRLKLHHHLQQITRHFWKRWSTEYLNSLQQRPKWKVKVPNSIRIGSLVLLHDEQAPVSDWRLGRIIELHPGSDKIVRVVSVKTKGGVFKRSITKISVLPIDEL